MDEQIKAYWRSVLPINWQDDQGIQNFEDVAQVVVVERGMSIEEARETIKPPCHLCVKYDLTQRADARMFLCPECGEMVCEDCSAEVAVVTASIIPDTDSLNYRGTIRLCRDCTDVC